MIGLDDKNWNIKYSAYTLAEMLIVMSIIMLVILSLPTMTKKVFKLDETRKSHGRYECYWDKQADGSKKLMTYYAEENGRQVTSESKTAADGVCKFVPPVNTIYFMVHAVGGGGGGAKIESANSALPATEQVSTYSNLYPTSEISYPAWVKHIMSKPISEIPWVDASGKTKSFFDVIETSKKQVVRYRLGGSAAKVVSLFVPQVPPTVTLEIKPGKGGLAIDKDESDQTKSDGEDTVVTYVYKDTGSGSKRIEALRARGGSGGNTSIDAKTSIILVGQDPGDLGLTGTAAVKVNSAGFSDMTESADSFDFLKTKIDYGAGDGGNGETQFVTNTDGFVLYEYDDVLELTGDGNRFGNHYKNITDKVSTSFYREEYSKSNCTQSTMSSITAARTAQCVGTDDDVYANTGHYTQFSCAVGDNENVWDDIVARNKMVCNDTTKCKEFTVSCGPSCYGGTASPVISPNPIGEGSGLFYDCSFEYGHFQLTCKTKLTNQVVHKCTGPSSTAGIKCTNGNTPTGSGSSKKCAASAGGDGAVVILW